MYCHRDSVGLLFVTENFSRKAYTCGLKTSSVHFLRKDSVEILEYYNSMPPSKNIV